MWNPVTAPFQNSQPLPPLPTTDEIRACTNFLWETMASNIVAVNDDIVVKYGGCINVWEGQALVYLERHVPEVPAPRLYAMYHDSKQLFLIMQRVPGVPLNSIWTSLAHSEKDDIIAKLQLIFDAMQKAECPWPDFFGGLDGGSVHHYLFYSQHGDEKFLGPFSGEPAFIAGLVGNYRAVVERNNLPDYKARFYETYLARVLQGHRTHGDVEQKNIMVVENLSHPNDQGGRSFDVALVDWENSGWFPDFWEFFCASDPLHFQWEEDWPWQVQEFVQVWPAEMAVMQLIDKDLGW
ncbi:phosphotransferase enzyme family protein [Aspergillus campestris IBT 28561]|uniref:Phosphotransferase enzyme family protein n=1 Tax=Aspergillus campestris (strain IBT 28561) TaxID=1392248 RepID=A0A2I1D892_ASPC2|nr:phosphotransferase enzyme family protein [Aspergillus campestris IBT 28561]PKY06058.1 phosphotransferase enzyme family protein [Aspergillus campestris IBT 28561]